MKRIATAMFLGFVLLFNSVAQDEKMTAFINELMSKMTVDEKIGQLNLVTGGDFVTGSSTNSNVSQKLRTGQIGGLFNVFNLAAMRSAQDIAVKESPNHIPI